MDIKYILGVIVVILLIGNIYFINEMQTSNQSLNEDNNWTVIGDKLIKLPNNFSLENKINQFNISNGSDIIYVYKISNSDLDSAIDEYTNQNLDKYSIHTEEFNSNFPSKKTTAMNNNSLITKYWFKVDNNVYQIQLNKNDSNFDEIVKDMINSMT